MNKIKIVLGVFTISCILSLANVKAASLATSYLGFAGITVPAMQGLYTSDSVTKTTESDQYIKKIGATDNLSGDERKVGAKLKNVTNYYVKTVKGEYVKLFDDNAGLGQLPADYKLVLKAGTWTVSSISFSGMWILDDNLL